jgi:hypothetical protein
MSHSMLSTHGYRLFSSPYLHNINVKATSYSEYGAALYCHPYWRFNWSKFARALDWREVALALGNLIVTLLDFLSKRVGSTKPWLPLPRLGTGYQTRVIGTFWDSPRQAWASDSQRFKSCSSQNSDRTCNYLITWERGVRSGKFLINKIKCRTMTR